jgi:hypothetical protein
MIINTTETKQIEVEIEVEIPYFYKSVIFNDHLKRTVLHGKVCEDWHGTIEITEDLTRQEIIAIEIEKESLRTVELAVWGDIERQTKSNATEYAEAWKQALQFIRNQEVSHENQIQ